MVWGNDCEHCGEKNTPTFLYKWCVKCAELFENSAKSGDTNFLVYNLFEKTELKKNDALCIKNIINHWKRKERRTKTWEQTIENTINTIIQENVTTMTKLEPHLKDEIHFDKADLKKMNEEYDTAVRLRNKASVIKEFVNIK